MVDGIEGDSWWAILALVYLVLQVIGLVIWVPCIIHRKKRVLKSKKFQSTYGTITAGIEVEYNASRYYYFYILARRLIVVSVMFMPFA